MSETPVREWVFPVDWSKVREFARAVQDDHWQAEPPVPPPTFPVYLTSAFIERLIVEELALDRARTVHGEQEYEYRRPLRVGERLVCRARVVRDYVKQGRRGGAMRFVICEVEMRSEASGELVLRERSTAIETAPEQAR